MQNTVFIAIGAILLIVLAFKIYKEQYLSVWNDRDARSKCDHLCSYRYPNQQPRFTGKWKVDNDTLSCDCARNVEHKKSYIGCSDQTSLNGKDCFFFNNSDATENCQTLCDKYLPNQSPQWTGNWKNTSIHTSACECAYSA
jgi:hypothetical protein